MQTGNILANAETLLLLVIGVVFFDMSWWCGFSLALVFLICRGGVILVWHFVIAGKE